MRVFALLIAPIAIIALSACTPTLPFVQSPDVPEACRTQVYGDPAVKDAIERANSQLQEVRLAGLALQKQAEALAVRRCLSGQGILPQGGVEPLKLN